MGAYSGTSFADRTTSVGRLVAGLFAGTDVTNARRPVTAKPRAVQVYKAIKGKFQVDFIRTGGGGNISSLDCMPMCKELFQQMVADDTEALEHQRD